MGSTKVIFEPNLLLTSSRQWLFCFSLQCEMGPAR